MEKEKGQYEFLNIDNSAELHEKSPSSPMSKDYVGEKKEKERKLCPYLSVPEEMPNRKYNIQTFVPLRIDNFAKSRKKLSCSPMSKDYAGEKEENERKLSPYLSVPEEMPNRKYNIQTFVPLRIDNFAKSREKLSSSPMSKDYAGEKEENERKLSPYISVTEEMPNRKYTIETFVPLRIDNFAKSREKLSSSPMSKDYAGGSAESDVEEEEYPEPIPFCFDESDEIGMARTREYLHKVVKIAEKELKTLCESLAYLRMKETLAHTHSEQIIITNNDQKDKKPEDIHKGQKDKKLEDIQVTKNEISRKYPSQCRFTILSLSFLPVFLLLLYFYSGISHIDHAPDIVELEKEILDHDKTIRVLTEYLQRDTPLLKVVALIGGTSVDKSYTVDIIKERLHKRNDNGFSSSYPTNFVVLKNLRAEHSTDVINFVRMYQEAYGSRQFTILAIFKIEQINDDSTHSRDMNRTINIVKDSFTDANIISKIIPFESLSEEILEKYIINTAKNIGQTFSREQINCNKRSLVADNINCKKAYGC
ncbi:hypothetical protein CAJAP_03519 [Camponotus japonicus]